MEIIKEFFDKNGDYHNDDGPAIIWDDGSYAWYCHGLCHNLNGIAHHIANVSDCYFVHGQPHRDNGPAAIYYSTGIPNDHLNDPKIKMQLWYHNGKLHRVDGPAYIVHIVSHYQAWYFEDMKINCSSQEEFEKLINLKTFW